MIGFSDSANPGAGRAPDRPGAEEAWPDLQRELLQHFRLAGVMERTPRLDLARGLAVIGLYSASFWGLLHRPSWTSPFHWLLLLAMAFSSVQGGMIAHDIGHRAFAWAPGTRSWTGQFFMTLLNGWPFANWVFLHHAHHRAVNEEDQDPDMQESIFALSPRQAATKRGLSRATTQWQHFLFWPLATLMAFPIRVRAVIFLWNRRRTNLVDPLVMVIHLLAWVFLPAQVLGWQTALMNYLLWTWMMGPYLMASFFWNHVGMRVISREERVPLLLQVLSCTRNLRAHWMLTLLFGGLNYHIEHHLAPTAPISNLNRARRILVKFCQERQLPYREVGYGEALAGVHRHVRQMAFVCRQGLERR